MSDSSSKLIKFEIKRRTVTYYLTTEEDLLNARSNSLLGDIFFALVSLTAGGIISVILTKATGIRLTQQTTDVLNVLLYVFISTTAICACFSYYFHFRSFNTIKKIKGSGSVKSFNSDNQEEIVDTVITHDVTPSKDLHLHIIKATYWTPKATLDVTEELRKMVIDDKLKTIASNKIRCDPDWGTVKKLTIEYRFAGVAVKKEFTEGEEIAIP
jgi:hypothetical protein